MLQYTHYFGRFDDVRGNLGGLPRWARTIVLIAALPGLALLALSMLAIVVSLSALLLLAAPVYTLLRRWTVHEQANGIRRVEATIIE